MYMNMYTVYMFEIDGLPHDEDLQAIVADLRAVGADSRHVEAKSSVGDLPKKLPRTISAFANTNGGLIILGLDEGAGFVLAPGFESGGIRKALEDACAHKVIPPVPALIEERVFEDGVLLLAWIPESVLTAKPCYVVSQGLYAGSYKRVGDSDLKLTHYEINRLLENQSQPMWDREVVPRATLEDLDQHLVSSLLAHERALKPRNFAKLSDQDALRRLNVADFDQEGVLRPTVAGLLALGEYPQQFFPRLNITFTAYPDTAKASAEGGPRFLDNQKIDGPIPVMLEEALNAVARNMRTGAVIVDGFRQELPDYPLEAVREAIVNALMHRDYSPEAQGQIQVNLYVDRMEILNPGGLYGNVTVETLGSAGLSSTRNQALSIILESTPFGSGFVAENRGSGYQAILSELQRATLPSPEPKNDLTHFLLTFYRRRLAEVEGEGNHRRDPAQAVTDYLATTTSATTREIAEVLGLHQATVRRVLRQLADDGTVQRMEPAQSPKQRYRLSR